MACCWLTVIQIDNYLSSEKQSLVAYVSLKNRSKKSKTDSTLANMWWMNEARSALTTLVAAPCWM